MCVRGCYRPRPRWREPVSSVTSNMGSRASIDKRSRQRNAYLFVARSTFKNRGGEASTVSICMHAGYANVVSRSASHTAAPPDANTTLLIEITHLRNVIAPRCICAVSRDLLNGRLARYHLSHGCVTCSCFYGFYRTFENCTADVRDISYVCTAR